MYSIGIHQVILLDILLVTVVATSFAVAVYRFHFIGCIFSTEQTQKTSEILNLSLIRNWQKERDIQIHSNTYTIIHKKLTRFVYLFALFS